MTLPPARRFLLIVLAYLGPLAVIPLVLARGARRDADVQWHAWQGLLFSTVVMLMVGGLTAMTGLTALSSLPAGISLGIVTWLAWALALVVQLAALVAGLAGSRVALPLFGSLASLLTGRSSGR